MPSCVWRDAWEDVEKGDKKSGHVLTCCPGPLIGGYFYHRSSCLYMLPSDWSTFVQTFVSQKQLSLQHNLLDLEWPTTNSSFWAKQMKMIVRPLKGIQQIQTLAMRWKYNSTIHPIIRIPSEMGEALRYMLLSLFTLFTLFTLLTSFTSLTPLTLKSLCRGWMDGTDGSYPLDCYDCHE